jgi:hypothetical protein
MEPDYDDMHSFKHVLNKHFFKFFFGVFGMISAGLLVAYSVHFYSNYREFDAQLKTQEAQRVDVERVRKLYEEDTYGGKTPEETLALFIDALKKGDTDLAAKYFVIDKQEEWKGRLGSIADVNLKSLLVDIQKAKLISSHDTSVRFEYKRQFNGNNVKVQGKNFELESGYVNQPIDMAKSPNGIWKIIDL